MSNIQTLTLSDFFSTYKQLQMDDVQRAYTWDEPAVELFLNYFKENARHGSQHPFGTVHIHREELNEAFVIDGQQRLCTSLMVLWALFRRFKQDGLSWFTGTDKTTYQKTLKHLNSLLPQTELKLLHGSQMATLGKIRDSVIGGESLRFVVGEDDPIIIAAWRTISKMVKKDEEPKSLLTLVRTILWAELAVYVHSSIIEARSTFEFINGGGKPLTALDLMKVRVMRELSDPAIQEDVLAVWGDMWATVTNKLKLRRTGNLLFLVDILHYDGDVSASITSQGIEDYIKNVAQASGGELTSEALVTYVGRLNSYANKLVCLSKCLNIHTNKEDPYLLLGQYISKSYVPRGTLSRITALLLSTTDAEEFSKLSEFCFFYTLFLILMGVGESRSTRDKFNAASKDISKLQDLLHLGQGISVREFKNNARGVAYKEALLKVLLFIKNERLLRGQDSTLLDRVKDLKRGRTQLEHVLPKGVEQYKQYERSLGNLVLLSGPDNKKAATKDFIDKQAIYADADAFPVTQKFSDEFKVNGFTVTDIGTWENFVLDTVFKEITKRFGSLP